MHVSNGSVLTAFRYFKEGVSTSGQSGQGKMELKQTLGTDKHEYEALKTD